jgi:hypothetical protein
MLTTEAKKILSDIFSALNYHGILTLAHAAFTLLLITKSNNEKGLGIVGEYFWILFAIVMMSRWKILKFFFKINLSPFIDYVVFQKFKYHNVIEM